MAAACDPSKPFSAELHVIRRLNSSLRRDAAKGGPKPGPGGPLPPKRVSLAPRRDDFQLLDPCCGLLSAGAEWNLGVRGRPRFIDFDHVPSAVRVPPGLKGQRPQTAPNPSGIHGDGSEDVVWNSRRVPDAALRAKLSDSYNRVGTEPHTRRTSGETTAAGLQDVSSPDLGQWTENSPAVLRYRYTSATQRSYEEVHWKTTTPRRSKAAEINMEKLAELVNERPWSRRYNSRPQLWQSVGAEWNRRQLRLRSDAMKPVSFGTIGSENMDDIDNKDKNFHPLTLKRSVIPPYTPTAHRSTIPGYTGRAAWTHSDDAALGPPAVNPQSIIDPGRREFGHAAPLSRMVTTTTPCNPFLRPPLPASRRDVRQSR